MKKYLSIFVAFIALCACNSEDVVSDELLVGSEENETQISRATGTRDSAIYPFINVMVGEDLRYTEPRKAFLKRDADYLLSRNASQQVTDLARLEAMYAEVDIKSFEDERDQKLLDLYGAEKLRQVTKALKARFYGDVEALDAIPLSPLEQVHINRTLLFIDDVAEPFKDLVLMKDFDSAKTHKECYDVAVEKVIELGVDYVFSEIASGGSFTLPISAYYALKLCKICWDYNNCLARVNGW